MCLSRARAVHPSRAPEPCARTTRPSRAPEPCARNALSRADSRRAEPSRAPDAFVCHDWALTFLHRRSFVPSCPPSPSPAVWRRQLAAASRTVLREKLPHLTYRLMSGIECSVTRVKSRCIFVCSSVRSLRVSAGWLCRVRACFVTLVARCGQGLFALSLLCGVADSRQSMLN